MPEDAPAPELTEEEILTSIFGEPVRLDIPEEPYQPCSCGSTERFTGYGLAGGGIGVYQSCEGCGKILFKQPDDEGVTNVPTNT